MASPFQQRALQRKLIYIASIIVLFSAAYLWRDRVVAKQAESLAIREQSRGDVDLIGTVVRLSTIGSRGWATCVVWTEALDAQKKNQWNELELWVRTMTKLQPHFITPWIFQSWNLAYNVSVESDRVNDKYFYIARGLELLSEGERRNHDNPEMRWSIGFFLQHKIGQSDETNALRSLSQLSMIPPNERDPGRFWTVRDGRQEVNLNEFEAFCKKHPQLVRRLREGIRRENKRDWVHQFRCDGIEQVVQFLQDNSRVPSLWEDVQPSQPGGWRENQDKLRPLADRFPVLPPERRGKLPASQQLFDDTALHDHSELKDEDDAFQVARAWYCYSQEPLPPPSELPGNSQPIIDRVHQRIPPHITTLIFRAHPAQSQRFSAERLYDEGWYDTTGWPIPDWFRDQGDKFADGEPAVVGGGKEWGLLAWQKTYDMWTKLGEANHLLFKTEAEKANMEKQALAFAQKYNLQAGSPVPALREETLDPDTQRELFAYRYMRDYETYRHVSNFPPHYYRAGVEERKETVTARKLFYEAEALRLKNSLSLALEKYEDPNALKAWREKVLLPNTSKDFRRDSFIQEQTFEVQLKYIDLYTELSGNDFKAQAARLVSLPMVNPPGAGACPAAFASWIAPMLRTDSNNPLLGGPFDGTDEEGFPIIDEMSRRQVLQRMYPDMVRAGPPEGMGMPPGKMPVPDAAVKPQ
jgi:hypothetical protein